MAASQNLDAWKRELRRLIAVEEEMTRRLDTVVEVSSNPLGDGPPIKVYGMPGPRQAFIAQRNDVRERIETIRRVIEGHKAATQPLVSRLPRLKYRSTLKRAISHQLIMNPTATDGEVCRGLDEDGTAVLPENWRCRPEDRSFFDAFCNPKKRHMIEVAISKIRHDHKNA